jgi:hypothetical protein
VQKTRAKNSHAWAPLNFNQDFFVACMLEGSANQCSVNTELFFAPQSIGSGTFYCLWLFK